MSYHKANGLFVFGAQGKVRRNMASDVLRVWFLVLLGAALASPPLRTLQLTAEKAAPVVVAPVLQRKQHRARTVNPRLATLPKARADSFDVVFALGCFTVRSESDRSSPSFAVRVTDKLPRRDPFYHPLRC